MADNADYFLQGASLGMKAVQSAQEDAQFYTNLAERARQFNKNRELALADQQLKLKQYDLAQKNYELDQARINSQIAVQQQQYNIVRDELLADERNAGSMGVWYQSLNSRQSPRDPIPPFPAGLTIKQTQEMTEAVRLNNLNLSQSGLAQAQEAADQMQLREATRMLELAIDVDPDIIDRDDQGRPFVSVQKFKSSTLIQDYLRQTRDEQSNRAMAAKSAAELARLKLENEQNPTATVVNTPAFIEWVTANKLTDMLAESEDKLRALYREQFGLPTPDDQVRDKTQLPPLGQSMFGDRLNPEARYSAVRESLPPYLVP